MKKRIKKSFACSQVQDFSLNEKLVATYTPKAGDVGVFKVLEAKGSYLVDPQGVQGNIFEGDLLMLAFGNRYATNQVEGYVPTKPLQECQLLGRGGVAGLVKSSNVIMRNGIPQLELVGYTVDMRGRVINTINAEALDVFDPLTIRSKVVLSIGSSMDSGKTTSAAYLCGGLNAAGYTTAYLKLTGTAFPKDARFVYDRGADFVADFTHFGYPSTYLCDHNEILNLYQSLVNLAQNAVNPDYIVVEIADGILQRETAALLRDSRFMSSIHQVLLSCGDSLGVLSGLRILEDMHIYPFAVSGLFTASELLIEEVENLVSIPVLRLKDLLNGKALICMDAPGYQHTDLILLEERA